MDRRAKILLVDDNREDYIIVRRVLSKVQRMSYDLDWVTSYDEAREAIAKDEYDVYLVDFRLGPDSGLDLIRDLQHNVPRRPMILLTAHGNDEVDFQAIRLGAADYLPKNELSPSLLARTIRHAIERNQLQERLYYQATHDELTGLFNRQHFLQMLRTTLSSAKRHDFPLSICLCDVDHFKEINDQYGHGAGDRVLTEIGRLFSEKLRTEDVPGRYGGDEFCILLPHAAINDAERIIERVRQNIQSVEFKSDEGDTFSTTVTFGISALGSEDVTPEVLISSADRALYHAKQSGRNRTSIHTET